MISASRPCPCGSDRPYSSCCAPFHRGLREPEDATALMRSRYAAFVTKDVDYLWRTLHADHADRARSAEQVRRELREACVSNRYLGLRVLDAREPDGNGVARVLFAARVFHRGREVSFVECSDFARCGASTTASERGWRYVGGEGASVSFDSVGAMTIEGFLGAGSV